MIKEMAHKNRGHKVKSLKGKVNRRNSIRGTQRFTKPSPTVDNAKVQINPETAIALLGNLKQKYKGTSNPYGFINDLRTALGIPTSKGASKYGVVDIPLANGILTSSISITNHNATAENYITHDANYPYNLRLLIRKEFQPNRFHPHSDVRLDEFVYYGKKIEKVEDPLVKIIDSLIDFLRTGIYKDTTGVAFLNTSPEITENKQNNTMKNTKKRIKLTESQLHKMIKKSVNEAYKIYNQYGMPSGEENTNIFDDSDDVLPSATRQDRLGDKSWKEYEREEFLKKNPHMRDYMLNQTKGFTCNDLQRAYDMLHYGTADADKRPLHRKGSLNRAMEESIRKSIKETINEIGDTQRGQFMLGRLASKRGGTDDDFVRRVSNDAYHTATPNGGLPSDAFQRGEEYQNDIDAPHTGFGSQSNAFRKMQNQYDAYKMNDMDKFGRKFIDFIEHYDGGVLLQDIVDYETGNKTGVSESPVLYLIGEFEDEVLGYECTPEMIEAIKRAYNQWWVYAEAEMIPEYYYGEDENLDESIRKTIRRVFR